MTSTRAAAGSEEVENPLETRSWWKRETYVTPDLLGEKNTQKCQKKSIKGMNAKYQIEEVPNLAEYQNHPKEC